MGWNPFHFEAVDISGLQLPPDVTVGLARLWAADSFWDTKAVECRVNRAFGITGQLQNGIQLPPKNRLWSRDLAYDCSYLDVFLAYTSSGSLRASLFAHIPRKMGLSSCGGCTSHLGLGGRPLVHTDLGPWALPSWNHVGNSQFWASHQAQSRRTCSQSASSWHRGHTLTAEFWLQTKAPCQTHLKAAAFVVRPSFLNSPSNFLPTVQSTPSCSSGAAIPVAMRWFTSFW